MFFLLILDEATSAVDGYTEAEISKALSGSVTIIILAHRLSTIEQADIISVMYNGKSTDQRTFDELIENSVVFQKDCKIPGIELMPLWSVVIYS